MALIRCERQWYSVFPPCILSWWTLENVSSLSAVLMKRRIGGLEEEATNELIALCDGTW